METAPERIMAGSTSLQPVTSLKSFQSVTAPGYWYDAAQNQVVVKLLWDADKIVLQIHGM
jgi:hypothetical protein